MFPSPPTTPEPISPIDPRPPIPGLRVTSSPISVGGADEYEYDGEVLLSSNIMQEHDQAQALEHAHERHGSYIKLHRDSDFPRPITPDEMELAGAGTSEWGAVDVRSSFGGAGANVSRHPSNSSFFNNVFLDASLRLGQDGRDGRDGWEGMERDDADDADEHAYGELTGVDGCRTRPLRVRKRNRVAPVGPSRMRRRSTLSLPCSPRSPTQPQSSIGIGHTTQPRTSLMGLGPAPVRNPSAASSAHRAITQSFFELSPIAPSPLASPITAPPLAPAPHSYPMPQASSSDRSASITSMHLNLGAAALPTAPSPPATPSTAGLSLQRERFSLVPPTPPFARSASHPTSSVRPAGRPDSPITPLTPSRAPSKAARLLGPPEPVPAASRKQLKKPPVGADASDRRRPPVSGRALARARAEESGAGGGKDHFRREPTQTIVELHRILDGLPAPRPVSEAHGDMAGVGAGMGVGHGKVSLTPHGDADGRVWVDLEEEAEEFASLMSARTRAEQSRDRASPFPPAPAARPEQHHSPRPNTNATPAPAPAPSISVNGRARRPAPARAAGNLKAALAADRDLAGFFRGDASDPDPTSSYRRGASSALPSDKAARAALLRARLAEKMGVDLEDVEVDSDEDEDEWDDEMLADLGLGPAVRGKQSALEKRLGVSMDELASAPRAQGSTAVAVADVMMDAAGAKGEEAWLFRALPILRHKEKKNKDKGVTGSADDKDENRVKVTRPWEKPHLGPSLGPISGPVPLSTSYPPTTLRSPLLAPNPFFARAQTEAHTGGNGAFDALAHPLGSRTPSPPRPKHRPPPLNLARLPPQRNLPIIAVVSPPVPHRGHMHSGSLGGVPVSRAQLGPRLDLDSTSGSASASGIKRSVPAPTGVPVSAEPNSGLSVVMSMSLSTSAMSSASARSVSRGGTPDINLRHVQAHAHAHPQPTTPFVRPRPAPTPAPAPSIPLPPLPAAPMPDALALGHIPRRMPMPNPRSMPGPNRSVSSALAVPRIHTRTDAPLPALPRSVSDTAAIAVRLMHPQSQAYAHAHAHAHALAQGRVQSHSVEMEREQQRERERERGHAHAQARPSNEIPIPRGRGSLDRDEDGCPISFFEPLTPTEPGGMAGMARNWGHGIKRAVRM